MYDYNTGKLISLKDENSAVTTYSYSDPLNRITQIVHSDGGQTNVTYPSPTHIIVYRDQNAFADQAIHSESYYDGLGSLNRISTKAAVPIFRPLKITTRWGVFTRHLTHFGLATPTGVLNTQPIISTMPLIVRPR